MSPQTLWYRSITPRPLCLSARPDPLRLRRWRIRECAAVYCESAGLRCASLSASSRAARSCRARRRSSMRSCTFFFTARRRLLKSIENGCAAKRAARRKRATACVSWSWSSSSSSSSPTLARHRETRVAAKNDKIRNTRTTQVSAGVGVVRGGVDLVRGGVDFRVDPAGRGDELLRRARC